MIYLNNAATTYPKPACVQQAVNTAMSALPREGQRSTFGGENETELCRAALAPLFGVQNPQRLFFTSGATESFNLILRGLNLGGKRVVATSAEHNALLRPLYALLSQQDIHIVQANNQGHVSAAEVTAAITPGTACVFVNHCSNVTGAVQDIAAIGRAAKAQGALFVVDASQSAGLLPIDVEEACIDILVFTGHKALFGPTGTGGFYLREGVALAPAKWGGTGTESDKIATTQPELFEVGTQNAIGLAGLAAGAAYVTKQGIENIAQNINKSIAALAATLGALPGVQVYCGAPPHGACLSFNINGISPADVGYILRHSYDIIVRAGYHCAPLLAQNIGAPSGTVRASISCLITPQELAALAAAVAEIAQSVAEDIP